MIEGIKVILTTNEFRALLNERVTRHEERGEFYKIEADRLEAGRAEAQTYTNGDPIKSLRDSQKQHEGNATRLNFLAAHLIEDEMYTLSDEDLEKVELIKRRW